jgi:hypothetical protein
MMAEKDHYRKDDSMLRKIAIGVLVAILVQAVGWVYMLGSLTNQVANNTKAISAMTVIIEKQGEASVSLVRVMTLVEGLTISVNRVADRLENVATEQNRRALIIDRADRYMEKNGE